MVSYGTLVRANTEISKYPKFGIEKERCGIAYGLHS